MSYLENLYTLVEISLNLNFSEEKIQELREDLGKKDKVVINEKYPELRKFLPYCEWYEIQGNNMLCMQAYMYDMYCTTGILPDLTIYDKNPDINKLEYWQYISPLSFEINPNNGFEFCKNMWNTEEIWNLFLAGCARMNYYEGKDVSLEQRIKYAIVEYMLRRKQFFSDEDFVDNPILHKKYGESEENENGKN